MIRFLILLIGLCNLSACKNTEAISVTPVTYLTKNVVVIVIDGPRYSETWGAENQQYIPRLAKDLAKEGVINTAFYNDGYTYTNAGHTAITTGVRQQINNGGAELPRNPSFFQHWLEATGSAFNKAWVVTSKDKLNILADTKHKDYAQKFMPSFDCGKNGPDSGYREDSVTFKAAKKIIATHKPNLLLINFKEPDASGHGANWEGYLKGISTTDEYVYQLWNFLQSLPEYRRTTTFIVTNDHGRHLDGHGNGFISHGDNCDGCRHINFYGAGPDFKKGILLNTNYNQTDIPATIAELMGFKMPNSQGKVMWELFANK